MKPTEISPQCIWSELHSWCQLCYTAGNQLNCQNFWENRNMCDVFVGFTTTDKEISLFSSTPGGHKQIQLPLPPEEVLTFPPKGYMHSLSPKYHDHPSLKCCLNLTRSVNSGKLHLLHIRLHPVTGLWFDSCQPSVSRPLTRKRC